ncbi:hypothetical protein Tco_0956075 [Tanacetum coccineum]|uniref:Uncharacterized protein n=1 Tax=Tanacetum coccineum TaxID=301880 RepID=A0ABQ5E913_9ASTR
MCENCCAPHSFCFSSSCRALAQSLIILFQQSIPSVSQTSGRSDSIMECVLHSFVAENEPDQDMIYEDFDQIMRQKTRLVRLRRNYGMMAGLHADNGGADVSKAAAGFVFLKGSMFYPDGIFIRFEKWKVSSKNLEKLINSSMSTRTKIGLGFKEYFGKDEVFDLLGRCMQFLPPSLELICPPIQVDIGGNTVDKSFRLRTYASVIHASRDPEPKTSHLLLISRLCQNSVPCKSKAASVPAGSRNSSASVTADGSDPAASRNRSAVNSAGRPKPTERVGHPAGWSKRPAPVSADRPVSAGQGWQLSNLEVDDVRISEKAPKKDIKA